MARKTFFSFHYDRDVWRVNQIRNCWVTKPSITEAGFIDAAAFEQLKRRGDDAIKRWIDEQLLNTTVTCVLIGRETSTRPWVKYEIRQSIARGNGFIGIYLNNVKDSAGNTDSIGHNPLDDFTYHGNDGKEYRWSSYYPTYDWANDKGYDNIGTWIEAAAKKAGK